MAKSKSKCRCGPGRPSGMTLADELARKRMIREATQAAAKDATVEVLANRATQRALWLAVVSIADAYGFGPERMQRFFDALQANTDELEQMRAEVDEDYAYEKLRLKAERVTGIGIEYLYEQDAFAAQVQQSRQADAVRSARTATAVK